VICIGNAVSCRRPPTFLFVNGIDLLDRDEDGERSLAKTTVESSPPLRYPPMARKQGIESDVVVLFSVLPDGTTSDIAVVRSEGEEFDRTAVEFVRHDRFRPATKDGLPVPARITTTIRFRLDQGR